MQRIVVGRQVLLVVVGAWPTEDGLKGGIALVWRRLPRPKRSVHGERCPVDEAGDDDGGCM